MSITVVKVGLNVDSEVVYRLVSSDNGPTTVSIPIDMIEQIEKVMRDYTSVQQYLARLRVEGNK